MKRSTSSSRLRHALAWATGLALLLALPVAAVLENGRDKVQLRKVVDGYVVDLTFPVAPRGADDNLVFVKLSTAHGEPASGATVSVAATPKMGEMSHPGGGSGADAHSGGETKSDDRMNMDMGGSDDHANMDMGGSDDQAPHKQTVPASTGTVLRPDRALGVHKGLISVRAGDASKMDVSFVVAGTTRAASFDIDIAQQRPRALVFGGFAAANLLVLVAAFFVRRRERAARLRRYA